MTFLRQMLAVAGKDMLVEWRSPGRVSGLFFFAFALLLIAAFTSGTAEVMRLQAGGILWLGMLLASTRSLDLSIATELDQGSLEGLVIWPVDGMAMFLGKAIANTLVLLLVVCALTPLAMALYDVTLEGDPGQFLLTLFLGTAALAAPGTLLATLTSRARGSSVLLPLLLFPLIVPAILAAARATTVLLDGDAMGDAGSWLRLLVAFNLIQWAAGMLVFGRIVEDG